MLIAPTDAPGMLGSSNIGMPPPPCWSSISISLSSSSPARSFLRKLSRGRRRGMRADERRQHALLGGELGTRLETLALGHP